MSVQSTDQSDLSDVSIAVEPGAGLEEMRRRAHVAPPPPPVMPAKMVPSSPPPKTESPDPGVAEPTQSSRDQAAQNPQIERGSTDAEAQLLGQAKGNVRQISTRLPLPLRQKLVAVSQREELTLGDVAMDAVRLHHHMLRERHKPRDADSRGFAPPRRRAKRSAAGEKVPTPMSVTPEEAEALQNLAEDVAMSVNRIVIECLEAAFESGMHTTKVADEEVVIVEGGSGR